jgi:hypothetical protein
MELIEVKSLIRAQKGNLYIIYEHVMGILGNQSNTLSFATRLGWLATAFYDYTLAISLPILNLKLCLQLKH